MQANLFSSSVVTALMVLNVDRANSAFIHTAPLVNSRVSNQFEDLRKTVTTLESSNSIFNQWESSSIGSKSALFDHHLLGHSFTPDEFDACDSPYGSSSDADELCHLDQQLFSNRACHDLTIDGDQQKQIKDDRDQRLAYVLCEYLTSHTHDDFILSESVLECLENVDYALEQGEVKEALNHMAELRSTLPQAVVDDLELGLTTVQGVTPLSFFRDPEAILPNGAKIPPDSFSGGFHGTMYIRPEVALSKGLPVRGENLSLLDHVLERGHSAFRGVTPTVSDPDGLSGAALWASDAGWVYDIRHVPTWSIEHDLEGRCAKQLGGFSGDPMVGELELAVPGYIPPENIKRFGKVVERHGRLCVTKWEMNPNYGFKDG